MTDANALPLARFTIIEVNDTNVPLCLRLATSLAAKIAADLGADVLKIEPPGGDPVRRAPPFLPQGESALFQFLNTSKRSLVLDLASDAGRTALKAPARQGRRRAVRGAGIDRAAAARRARDADRDRGVSGRDERRHPAGQRIRDPGAGRAAAHGGRARAQAAAAGRPSGLLRRGPHRLHRPCRRACRPRRRPDGARSACRWPK